MSRGYAKSIQSLKFFDLEFQFAMPKDDAAKAAKKAAKAAKRAESAASGVSAPVLAVPAALVEDVEVEMADGTKGSEKVHRDCFLGL